MAYLYGDGTKSNLESNYIEFLRDVLDFTVDVLMAEHRVRKCRDGGGEKRKAAEAELERLKNLSHGITRVLDESAQGPEKSTTNRCVSNIRQSASAAIKKAADHVKGTLTEELKKITSQVQRERSSNFKALEKLLLRHDLPDSVHRVNVKLENGQSYAARLAGHAGVKVEWVIDLDIPADHLFSSPLRVERISPALEIKVPEKGGIVRKSMRLRVQKLANKHIVELARSSRDTTIKLRAAPDPDSEGYDLIITDSAPRVRLCRVSRGGESSAPFEPLEEDCAKLLELHEALTSASAELTASRRSLVEARLDGKDLGEHDDPSVIVSRLVERMAPTVQQIAKHSLAPEELVLKRVLSNDRREEVFAAKADLRAKIEPVPLELRGVFAPLGLGDLAEGQGRKSAAGERELSPSITSGSTESAAETDAAGEDAKTAVSQKPAEDGGEPVTFYDRPPKGGSAATADTAKAPEKSIDVALAELESDN